MGCPGIAAIGLDWMLAFCCVCDDPRAYPGGLNNWIVTQKTLELQERQSRVLIVCAHEPMADPRISWAARSASIAFEVTVVGFAADNSGHHEVHGTGGYQIVRLQRSSVGISR